MNKEKFQQIEKIILAAGILTLIVAIVMVGYSLGFLSTNLLQALSPDTNIGEQVLEFDVQGFENLGLEEGK